MFIYGSENRKLIPELKTILDTDDWYNDVIRAFEKNPIEEVEWKDNSKVKIHFFQKQQIEDYRKTGLFCFDDEEHGFRHSLKGE